MVRTNGGGVFHTVATLPTGAFVLGAGGHFLLAAYPDSHLHTVNLATSADVDRGGATGDTYFGAAWAPDGHRVAYVRASSPSHATLEVLDVTSGTASTLRSFAGNNYDVPIVWNATSMGAFGVVGFADAGPQGVASLDPATGTRTSATDTTDGGAVIATDVVHAADAAHTAGADDGDGGGGPGPQGPFNTLRTITIGSVPVNVVVETHHNISVLAVSADGSTIVTFDDSAAGGFAGISLSPDFGLITWSGGHKTQVDHYGTRWDAAAFTGSSTFIAAKHVGASEMLVSVAGTAIAPLDTFVGDGPAAVYSVSG